MHIVYSGEEAPKKVSKSIFLAGPSMRHAGDINWRPEAFKILEKLGYDGVVYAPIWREGAKPQKEKTFDYDGQIEWETKYLQQADVILFWVPRDLEKAPGMTTNVEWGLYLHSGRCVLGYPKDAVKMTYLDWWAHREGAPVYHTLEDTLKEALKRIGEGSERTGGERDIPLQVWQKQDFQDWYKAQKGAGNVLRSAHVVWSFRVGKNKERTFLYSLHVDVWITSENRAKTNEIVIFRPDISAVVAYKRGRTLLETEIALVKEFRSPVSNQDCYVHELPGGSSLKPGQQPEQVASDELREETGLEVAASRFRYIGARQIAPTLAAHKAHVFAVELNDSDMLKLRWLALQVHGNHEDSEYTYIEIKTVGELLQSPQVGWADLGMLLSTIL